MSGILATPDLIPGCLQRRRQWLPWRWEWKDERQTKVPIDPRTGNWAKWTEPAVLVSFKGALAYVLAGNADGLAFVFQETDPYVGIDLDSCRTRQGKVRAWAAQIVDELSTYCEISPSGSGLKLILRGHKPAWAKCKVPPRFLTGLTATNPDKGIEIALKERGCFALTGRVYRYGAIRTGPRRLVDFCRRYWSDKRPAVPTTCRKIELTTELDAVTSINLQSRLRAAERAYPGDGQGGQSRHDFGIICYLLRQGVDPYSLWPDLRNYSKFCRAGLPYFDTTVFNAKRELGMS